MLKKEFINEIELFCPLSEGESWDNCGFQINGYKDEISKVLVALEITDQVIDEAVDNQVDLILTHHPMLFTSIKCIDYNSIIGNQINRLITQGISVYATHTNFDKIREGNNDYLGDMLGLKNIRFFEDGNEFCRKGNTPFEVTFVEFIHKASDILEIDERLFNIVGDLRKSVDTIGWCTGSGSEFIENAVEEGCDMFLTGDLKYHQAQIAKQSGLCVLDIGHYGSEKIFVENMAGLLLDTVNNVEIIESKVDIDPFSVI